jgi:predicted ester cyclase
MLCATPGALCRRFKTFGRVSNREDNPGDWAPVSPGMDIPGDLYHQRKGGMMKNVHMFLILVLILCLIAACQNNAELEEFKAQAELEKANKALAERFFEAAFKPDPDLDAIREILSPDYVHHPQLGTDESLEDALKGLQERVTMFPDQAMTVEDMFVKGNKIVFRGIFSGTHMGDSEGFLATGKKVKMRGFSILRVENGKIVEAWGGRDLLSLYHQLGFEMKLKEEN